MATTGRGPPVTAVFLTGSILAGGNAVGVKFLNDELDPLWGAALRFALASVILMGLMLALRRPMPRGRTLAGSLLYGVINFGAAFGFAFLALVQLEAGFGQLVLAMVPLATLLLARAHGLEALTRRGLIGAGLGLAGMMVLTRGSLGAAAILPLLALMASVLSFAEGALVVRVFPPRDALSYNAVGMSAATIVLLAAAALTGSSVALPTLRATWMALIYLVIIGSVVVFLMYVYVLRHWDASRATYTFILTPPVTLLVSHWMRSEPIGPGLLLGGILITTGVYVGAIKRIPAN